MSRMSRRYRPKAVQRRLVHWLMSLVRRPSELTTPHVRRAIEDEVLGNAKLGNGYFLLLFCACGIATLGLLQSSVAVVIGAMLISPLMGPIMAMGLTLARLEFSRFNRAAVSLAVGAVVSILAAMLIVWASPLKDVTPEILARTRPTLLDLVVAALSGVVGAFVVMARKGGVIAGVAIATALMPPLAVIGYGLATGSWAIAGGAALLFVTNVVAILGAVLVVARRYGFVPARHGHTFWETATICVILVVLSTPLVLSLSDIVAETRLTNQVRGDISTLFRNHNSRVSDLRVMVSHGRVTAIQAVVVTKGYVPDATASLKRRYGGTPDVNIEQVLAANEQTLLAGLRAAAPLASEAKTPPGLDPFVKTLLSKVAVVDSVQSDAGGTRIQVRLLSGGTLADYREVETALAQLAPDARAVIVPPPQTLPPVPFAPGSAVLSDEQHAAVAAAAWALSRWGLTHVDLVGSAPPRHPTLARQRAEAVAAALREANIGDIALAIAVTQDDSAAVDRVTLVPARPATSQSTAPETQAPSSASASAVPD